MMLVFEKLHLERQNGKQFIHIPLDILDTVFFPRPYLRRDIIIDRDLRLSSQELGNIQVKTDNPPVSLHPAAMPQYPLYIVSYWQRLCANAVTPEIKPI